MGSVEEGIICFALVIEVVLVVVYGALSRRTFHLPRGDGRADVCFLSYLLKISCFGLQMLLKCPIPWPNVASFGEK